MNLAGLIQWLTSAFKADELLRFVELGPAGRQIVANLEGRSLAAVAHEAVMGWERHKVPESEVRDLLFLARPFRVDEVKPFFKKTAFDDVWKSPCLR